MWAQHMLWCYRFKILAIFGKQMLAVPECSTEADPIHMPNFFLDFICHGTRGRLDQEADDCLLSSICL